MFRDLENLQLLQKLEQKLKSGAIIFWVDSQDCYLWENTFHYSNKIKVGDLSLTKENYFKKLAAEVEKIAGEREVRNKFLHSKFSEISDLELIKEFSRRTQYQSIRLSMYSGNNTIFIEGKDIGCGGGNSLPIKIKTKDPNL